MAAERSITSCATGSISARSFMAATAIRASTNPSFRENYGIRLPHSWQPINQARRNGKSVSTPSLLSGILFDPWGMRFTPTHAVKNGKRYRYYTSQAAIQHGDKQPELARIPARELETLVTAEILTLLKATDKCVSGLEGPEKDLAIESTLNLAKRWPDVDVSSQHEFVRNILRRVTVGQTNVWIDVDRGRLIEILLGNRFESDNLGAKRDVIRLNAEFQLLHRGREVHLVAPNDSASEVIPIPSLIKAVARAYVWYERIVAGEVKTINDLARDTRITPTYVIRILRCAVLSPKVVEIVLSGKHQPNLTVVGS
jgi:site-specific DNA recombinase